MLTQVPFDKYTTTAGQTKQQKAMTDMDFNQGLFQALDVNPGGTLEAFKK